MATYYLDYENGNNANSGADWANAWKDLTNGATAARIAPGDTIRIAKSPDPVSLGMTATWTNLSKTVTLASALTLVVDGCGSGWTAANSSTVTHPTATRKEGSAHVTVTKATYATSTLYAYKALAGSTDFSAYDALTFWFRNDAAIADANRWYLALCSDAAGATPVDVFPIPAIPSTNRWLPLTIAKSGGGNLGAAIQSVALYTGTSAPTGGQDCLIDNINACTFGGFSLQSLISKSGNAHITASDETWHGIQSIVGTTVLLDNDTNTIANAGRGYYGATETVTTYRRETIKTALAASAATQVQTVQDSGSEAGGSITFSGGWDTGTTVQDGETFLDGLNGMGYGITSAAKTVVAAERLSACRYNTAFYMSGSQCASDWSIGAALCTAGQAVYADTAASLSVAVAHINNVGGNQGLFAFQTAGCALTAWRCYNNATHGINTQYGTGLTIRSADIKNCGGNSVAATDCAPLLVGFDCGSNVAGWSTTRATPTFIDSVNAEATEVGAVSACTNTRIRSQNHDLSGYDWEWTDGGTINSEATDRVGGTGKMWKLLTSSTTRTAAYPLDWELGPVALVGGETNTVKVWMRKAHATNVNGRLVCRGGQADGITTDEVATLADNTDWQELTLTLSPTDDCVVMLEVWAEYVAGHAAVYVDEISEVSAA